MQLYFIRIIRDLVSTMTRSYCRHTGSKENVLNYMLCKTKQRTVQHIIAKFSSYISLLVNLVKGKVVVRFLLIR